MLHYKIETVVWKKECANNIPEETQHLASLLVCRQSIMLRKMYFQDIKGKTIFLTCFFRRFDLARPGVPFFIYGRGEPGKTFNVNTLSMITPVL